MTPYQLNSSDLDGERFFLTMSWRCLGVLTLPFVQPGDFPRGFGERADVPTCSKTVHRLWCTRWGVSLVCVFCQGNGLSLTRGRARNNIQWASPTSSVHVSPVFALWKHGSVYPNSRPLSRSREAAFGLSRVLGGIAYSHFALNLSFNTSLAIS